MEMTTNRETFIRQTMDKDRESYVEAMNAGIEQRGEVEKAVADLWGKGRKNVYLVGCGGSLAVMEPMRYFINRFSSLPVYAINSNEFVHMKPADFGADSLYITSSYTGTTPETVAAAQYAKSQGARIIAFTRHPESPLGQAADYSFKCDSKLVIMYQIIFYMLMLNGDFRREHYEELQSCLSRMPDIMYDARLQAQDKAADFAIRYKDEKFFFVTGSGAAYGEAYTFGNCLLEEMLWVYAHPVHAGEFFHGAFEMLTDETPIIVIQGEDATRPLSDRVLAFAPRHSNKVIHVDSAEYAPEIKGTLMREIFTPFILSEVLRVYAYKLSITRQHPMTIRRYMFNAEY